MKRIISVILSLALAAVMITPVFADTKITSDEVKELMEKTVLLSKQDYCDEILNMPVQNPDDVFDNHKLREFIDADRTIIEEVHFDDYGNVSQAFMYSWDEDGTLHHVVADYSVRAVHYAIHNARDIINAYIYNNIGVLGEGFPTSFLNYEKSASLLNKYELKNITQIAFKSFAMGLDVIADGVEYWVNDDCCLTPEEFLKYDEEMMAEQENERQEKLDKKRAVTPEEYQSYLDMNGQEYEGEKTEYLAKYTDTEPRFVDLGDDKLLIHSTAMLNDMGIISGYEDGTCRPEGTITRAEASKILSKLVKGNYNTNFDFPDTKNHWSRDAVNYLTAANVIHGFDDGTFRPDTEITYGQAIILVYSIMGYNSNIYDSDKTLTLMRCGLFEGVDSFTPEQPISRGNFVKLVANAFDTELMMARAYFAESEPIFEWNYDGVTLGMYLDGIQPTSGEYFVSREAYEEWKGKMSELFDELYGNYEG